MGQLISLAVQSFATDRRGMIVQDTKCEYAKVSDAVSAKKKDNTLMVFVDCDKEKLAQVSSFVQTQGMELYPTKSKSGRRYILGNQRGSGATVECAIE